MKKMSKGMLMTALICGAVYLGGSPVYASELQEFSLDEYVVTAARTETNLVDTPANISVVDSQTIEERHYQDVSEVLKDVPGANVLDSGSGAYEKAISLNGDTRVLVLVDGKRVGFASGTSTGSATYDMNLLPDVNLIERVEVLKGAGGALYGSDAVGGVVNIITKKADISFGKLNIAVGSNDYKDMSAIYSIKESKTGVTVSASKEKQGYFKFKDIATNKTTRWPVNSKYESEKVSLKLEQELSDNSNLTVGYDYSKFDGFSPGDFFNGSGVSYNDIETNNVYAKLDWNLNQNDAGYIQYYHNEYDYFSESAIGYGVWGDKKEVTNGIDIQQTIAMNTANKLVIGTSWYETEVDNKGKYNESIDNVAFFVNDTWNFAHNWSLNTGLRYDNHSNAGDETTLSAGLNKKFDDNSHAYINWGQVFKVASTGDFFNYDPPGPGWGATYGDPNLKPETGDTWTIGYSTKLNNNTGFTVNYFESNLEDAIVWKPVGSDYCALNLAKQKKRGLEINVDHAFNDNVKLEASYTYIRVKDNEGEGYLRDWNYIPNTFRIGLNYREGKWNSNIWMRAGTGAATHNYNAAYNKDASYIESDYWTIDCSISYNATKDLSFYVKGYNLFNEAYADFAGAYKGSYNYPAQSRRFIVGAEYKF